MQELKKIISGTLQKCLNHEITEQEYFSISTAHSFETYLDSSRNENIVNVLAGTLKSGLSAKPVFFDYYLAKGISPNLADTSKNKTPVFYCSHNLEVLKLLHGAGADLEHKDFGQNTFVMYGVNFDVLEFAFAKGCDLSSVNMNGNNFLYSLFANNYNHGAEPLNQQLKILTYILDKQIFDLNSYNQNQLSVLQFAITLGDLPLEALQLFMQHGADPDLQTLRETSYRLWSDERSAMPVGTKTIDLFKAQKKTLETEYKNGLIYDEHHYDKGVNYFTKAIEILEGGKIAL